MSGTALLTSGVARSTEPAAGYTRRVPPTVSGLRVEGTVASSDPVGLTLAMKNGVTYRTAVDTIDQMEVVRLGHLFGDGVAKHRCPEALKCLSEKVGYVGPVEYYHYFSCFLGSLPTGIT